MMYTATAFALMFGTASGAVTSNTEYFQKIAPCKMKLDGTMVIGTSGGDGLGSPTCPVTDHTAPDGNACATAVNNLAADWHDGKERIKTFEITEASVQTLGTRSKGYTTWQPDLDNRGWGKWVDPESPICGDALAMQAAESCGIVTSTMKVCGPKYVKYDEAKMTIYKGGADVDESEAIYQLCGPHQKVACEDSIYDTAIVLFFLICGAALVIIFFQCSLMGLYDLLFGGKADVGDGASAPGATNQP